MKLDMHVTHPGTI